NQLDAYPKNAIASTKILFTNFGKNEEAHCLPLLKKVREAGVSAEIYPEAAKMKKQMSYADNKNISFVALVGENEINEGLITLKNMKTGEQIKVTPEQLISKISK
ncbi:MAG: His/Gly/Thr/Pro-type tRNA ligase C-terminal domain-containing protein, partial [Bacteroidota bacterium]|nr:His/Gly/Thr/Pro-type tRNA ligase C-terminal domain-containing protein [Bacteroidota bacterium]